MFDGLKLLEEELNNYIKKVDKPLEILEVGAKAFVKDLLKLPKPMSQIRKSGYTHLVNTFAYRVNKKDIDVGWGKYYGPMVEEGTKRMNAQPHLYPLWKINKEKYYNLMLKKFYN